MHSRSSTGASRRSRTIGTLLAATVLAGCALVPDAQQSVAESRCPDASRCLELGLLMAAAEAPTTQDHMAPAAPSTAHEDRPPFERELVAAIADVQRGDEAAARASLEHLETVIDARCLGAREVVKLYLAYLDRTTLRARLLEANDTIKALADVEKTLLESESDTNRVEGR